MLARGLERKAHWLGEPNQRQRPYGDLHNRAARVRLSGKQQLIDRSGEEDHQERYRQTYDGRDEHELKDLMGGRFLALTVRSGYDGIVDGAETVRNGNQPGG